MRLWHIPKMSRKFSGERKFGLYWYGRDVNRIGYHSALVQLFHSIWFQGIWHRYFSRETKENYVPVVDAFIPVSIFLYGVITPDSQSFDALPEK